MSPEGEARVSERVTQRGEVKLGQCGLGSTSTVLLLAVMFDKLKSWSELKESLELTIMTWHCGSCCSDSDHRSCSAR